MHNPNGSISLQSITPTQQYSSSSLTRIQQAAYYMLEIDEFLAKLFYSTTGMPDGSGTPLIEFEHHQNWSTWTNGAYGYIRWSEEAYFDNFTLMLAPEPGSAMLVFLAGLGLLRRRRNV
jgi:hypothetical protein